MADRKWSWALALASMLILQIGSFGIILNPLSTPEVQAENGVTFLFKFGSFGSGNGQFNNPITVDADASGNVYVGDLFNHRVQKFDANGNFILKWGSFGSGQGQFNQPQGIAADSSGNVYVVDTNNHRVQKFDSNGNFIAMWGSFGSGNGQFNQPHGVDVDSSGNVYVTDGVNNRVQKFDSNGNFITKWGSSGSGNGQFGGPQDIAVDSSAFVYVVEFGNHRVQKFDSNGNFITKWGSFGTADGQFNAPHTLDVDSAVVYVTDTFNHRIQKFDSNGNFITKWGSFGSGDGQFNLPVGIAVHPSGNVYVSDQSNHRIQVFGASRIFPIEDNETNPGFGGEGANNNTPFNTPQATLGLTACANHRVFLKFDASSFPAFSGSGTLRLKAFHSADDAANYNPNEVQIRAVQVSNAWSHTTITHNNQPSELPGATPVIVPNPVVTAGPIFNLDISMSGITTENGIFSIKLSDTVGGNCSAHITIFTVDSSNIDNRPFFESGTGFSDDFNRTDPSPWFKVEGFGCAPCPGGTFRGTGSIAIENGELSVITDSVFYNVYAVRTFDPVSDFEISAKAKIMPDSHSNTNFAIFLGSYSSLSEFDQPDFVANRLVFGYDGTFKEFRVEQAAIGTLKFPTAQIAKNTFTELKIVRSGNTWQFFANNQLITTQQITSPSSINFIALGSGVGVSGGGTHVHWDDAKMMLSSQLPPPSPAPPEEFGVAAGEGEVSLVWTLPASGSLSDPRVTGYRIYRGFSSNEMSLLTTIEEARPSAFKDSTVRNGVSYCYKMTALAGAVEGSATDVRCVTPHSFGSSLVKLQASQYSSSSISYPRDPIISVARTGDFLEFTFSVTSDGDYALAVYGKEDKPGPVNINISIDGISSSSISFSANDNDFRERTSFPLPLVRGIHTVRLTFVNDFATGPGDDRNFYLHWIRIPLEAFLDTDGDGLLDTWESAGIDVNDDGKIDLDLPALEANPLHRDIFVEVDYMDLHRPRPEAINDVIMAFQNSPVSNPDGITGIKLHVEIAHVGEAIRHDNSTDVWAEFDQTKDRNFGTLAQRLDANSDNILAAKRLVYHYALFIHQQSGTCSSGRGEMPGNDFIVSLGCRGWGPDAGGHPVGTRDEQAGTFMHELGHNLGLDHGGGDFINCKPNYLSVMNYAFQFSLPVGNRPLDYSREKIDTLVEIGIPFVSGLDEKRGVPGVITRGLTTVYGPPVTLAAGPPPILVANFATVGDEINWNGDGDTDDRFVSRNINNLQGVIPSGCSGFDILGILAGFNDWESLRYEFSSSANFEDGAHVNVPDEDEMTPEAKMSIRTGLVYGINDFIQKLPGSAFDNPELASQRKNTLQKSLLLDPDNVSALIDSDKIWKAIGKLRKDLRVKADSSVGGSPKNDWIVDPEVQHELLSMIDNLISSLLKQL